MRGKWTTVLAAAAFVLAVFALTPVGNATKSLIAPNADRVDGIHASKTAKAGQLLPLNARKKFPSSVVPTVIGPKGEKGDTGAAGAQGETGAPGAKGDKGDTGATGAQGATGATGAQGPKGDQGPAAAMVAVAAHVRNVGSVTTGAPGAGVTVPLSGNSWTQGATSTNLLYGIASIRFPDACDDVSPGNPGYVWISVHMEAPAPVLILVASERLDFSPAFAGHARLVPLSFDPIGGALVAPGTDTPQRMLAWVYDECGGAGQDFTVESLKIDVISVN